MECEKCNNLDWNDFEELEKDYIFTGSSCGFHAKVNLLVKIRCKKCGYEFEECIPLEDLY
nr:hypothetical protein [Clostridioides sp.]